LIVRTWPSASLTEAPALKADRLAAVAGTETPADLRHTPFSQSLLVKLLIALLWALLPVPGVGAGVLGVVVEPDRAVTLFGWPVALASSFAPSSIRLMCAPEK